MKHTRLLCQLTATIVLALATIGCSTGPTLDQAEDEAHPVSELLYGSDQWPELTVGRLASAQDSEDRWAEANRNTQAKLMKRVSLSHKAIDFSDVIDIIRDETGVSIFVNWPALELVGTGPDSLATLSIQDVPAEVMLDFVLEEVTADTFDGDRASFIIEQGVVKISTVWNLQRNETRVYNARALLYQTERLQASLYRDHERADELVRLMNQGTWQQLDLDLRKALSSNTSGGNEQKQNGKEPESSVPIEERIDILIGVIETVVGDPNEWVEETHLITELNGNLIINTTREYHQEITALLETLNTLQTQHFVAQARSIEVFPLLQDAEELRLNQQYKPALKKIEQALRVDPTSLEAVGLKGIITTTMNREP